MKTKKISAALQFSAPAAMSEKDAKAAIMELIRLGLAECERKQRTNEFLVTLAESTALSAPDSAKAQKEDSLLQLNDIRVS